jgi:hypothetical protein
MPLSILICYEPLPPPQMTFDYGTSKTSTRFLFQEAVPTHLGYDAQGGDLVAEGLEVVVLQPRLLAQQLHSDQSWSKIRYVLVVGYKYCIHLI